MKIYVIVLFMFSFHFNAKAVTEKLQTKITVKFGDKVSHFDFSNKEVLNFSNNNGKKSTLKLNQADQKFVMDTIDNLQKEQSHELRFCSNKYAVITKNNKSIISCLSSNTKLGTDTRELVNTLSLLL